MAVACLGWQRADVYGRVLGFRRAAEVLARHMLDEGHDEDLDGIVFPFVNCWRHYVELQLKKLSAALDQLASEEVKTRGGHNLAQLWSEFQAVLRRVYGERGQDELRDAGRLILQLAELDPLGEDFRYAVRRGSRGPTLLDVDSLDIAEFHTAMLAVAELLEAVDFRIDYYLDVKREMEGQAMRDRQN